MAPRFWPLERGYIVTDTFGWQNWRGGVHYGVDFGREGGSGNMPVFAVQGGTVVNSGPASGFGQWVVIDHPAADGGGTTVYGHVIPEVAVGRRVEAGQRIARINPDSNSNGGVAPHLHLEWHRFVWVGPGPDRLDPLPLLRDAAFPGEAPPAPAPAPEPVGLTAETLAEAMGHAVPIERYRALLPAFTDALRQAGCTTIERAAMFCAQIGHESAGLRYMEEIASGAAYEGRSDLSNTQPGDGVRFKGRGPIQITGRHNYTALSRWAHEHGYIPSPTFFVDQPAQLASDRYGFLGAVWYWTVARPQINSLCDDRNLDAVTRAINGGINGIDDRRERYERCLRLGAALLPDDGGLFNMLPKHEQEEMRDKIRDLHHFLVKEEPSMVDPAKSYAAATLIRTGDYHAAKSHAYAREARDTAAEARDLAREVRDVVKSKGAGK